MIDKNKKYQTRDGHDVRIYATDGDPDYPVHGAWMDGGGRWIGDKWTADGRSFFSGCNEHGLVEVTPERVVWINEYDFGIRGYDARKTADNLCKNRIALHRVVLGKGTRVDD